MASRDLYPQEILQVVLDKSCAKAQSSIPTLAILSVLGSQRHSARMGRSCNFTRRRRVPNRLDLHPAWRRRAGNQQHDDHVFRQIGGTDFLQNVAAQLGYRLHGQFGGHAGNGFFPRILCRYD